MQSYKRASNRSFPTADVDETTMALQTLGMRIRKSINDGYMIPDATSNQLPRMDIASNNSYMTSYQSDHVRNMNTLNNGNGANNNAFKTPAQFQRVALPSHLQSTGPPPLDYYGSTASSLADWENNVDNSKNLAAPLQPFFQMHQSPSKRKRDDEFEDEVSDSKVSSNADVQLNTFVDKYGPLSFDEEF